MKIWQLPPAVLFALAVFLWPVAVFGQHYVEAFEHGKIDWSNGIIEATGRGYPPEKPDNPAQGRAVAEREAIKMARKNLLKIAEGIQINSKVMIKDLLSENQEIREEFLGLMKNAPLIDVTYEKNGAVMASVTFEIRGPFSGLVLPGSIRKIESLLQPKTTDREEVPSFSGLIIDCRGFQVKSAMAPLVTDEDGQVIYGPAYISREHAIASCVAGYARDLQAAKADPRVSKNPFIIKGIRTAETGVSDVVISNADAAKIRGTASHLSLLQKCKVVIVID